MINAHGISIIAKPPANGANNDANNTEATVITGVNLNTQEVVVLITKPFFISLIKSKNG